ncbi:hypothetical protein HPB52_008173 [Rhipicephalus sanguineus]|uniref:Receptor ligand binding region domain-containing protein n=1 Tax=Rhipicephalus sanguineus TaxID=34632 RepID=A0A9D4PN85_RHISA|nr:hypothetical protein HPB52_008173 [Rhipicephalus sanguineus]
MDVYISELTDTLQTPGILSPSHTELSEEFDSFEEKIFVPRLVTLLYRLRWGHDASVSHWTASFTFADRKVVLLEGDQLDDGRLAQVRRVTTVDAEWSQPRPKTVDDINSSPDLLPNSTLGIQIRDSCQYAAIALEQVSQMIKRSAWSKVEYREEPHPYHRPPPDVNTVRAARCEDSAPVKDLVAVVGPLLEGGAHDVHSLMSLFKITVVGYAFDGQQPDSSSLQGYYVSVAPSNESTQARAMADLVTYFNWTYVSTVFTNGGHDCREGVCR